MYQYSQESEMILGITRYGNEYHPVYSFNTGGPHSRTRKEKIYTTVLGNFDGPIRCLKVISLGLDFGENIPVQWMERLLEEEGLSSPEELRCYYMTIHAMCVCHISKKPTPIRVENASRRQVLHQAFLLGLCTATFFDPSRPVIWTNSSLTRCLDLFDVQGFYV